MVPDPPTYTERSTKPPSRQAFPSHRRSGKLIGMGEVLPIPTVGDVFRDVRGDDRTMRVSYHQDRGVVVVSLWAGAACRGSFRLAANDAGRLVALFSDIVSSAGVTGPNDTEIQAVADTIAAAPQRSAPSPDQTGDVSMSALPTLPIPRVA